ncbi:DUF1801 domain-containing protein [Candidatus Parcubacteria bacterium]|nr:DUF1801 domain-containing protein [Candidatus Parcubacteria bacterium]
MIKQINDYIARQTSWQQIILKELRRLIHETDPAVEEKIKWGTPAFDDHGPVAWMFCAKNWVHLSFPQGALLDSSHGLFEEDSSSSKINRTIKIRKNEKINGLLIKKLVEQAVSNNKSGKKIKFTPAAKKEIVLPDDMAAELKAHGLEKDFWSRAYYQQKGYIGWIESAKLDATRVRRLRKMLEELQEGSYMPPKKR